VNHIEQMAMDAGALLEHMFPEAASRADELRIDRFLDRMRAGAAVVWELHGESVFELAQTWRSDTARGWAAFAIPLADATLAVSLGRAERAANDSHFAVREWAWLSVRDLVEGDLKESLEILIRVASSNSMYSQRFAVEVTRPRGVWSRHILSLKRDPWQALGLLESAMPANQRYLQDSIANWLNDASRTQERWVRNLCDSWGARWGADSAYVRRRALRSVKDR
jgi:3-methyladenine DNA glycosylase AlkC